MILQMPKDPVLNSLAGQIAEIGVTARDDPKVLTDLRRFVRFVNEIERSAAADSPAVAERKRRGRAAYLRAELEKLETSR